MATLLSVNVGLPKDVEWQGRTVHTGIWKHPVEGPRLVRRLNVDGDGQGDLSGHGGEQRAVFVYQVESYAHWQDHFGRHDFEYGQFGENFTVDGLSDQDVCVGDRYRIGEAEFEVTQPRVTCYRVGLRMGEPELPALLVAHRRPGFYFRVIREGHVRAGDQIVPTRIGRHGISVADIDALLYLPGRDIAQLRLAVDIPALSPGWQQSFRDLLDSADNETRAVAQPVGTEPGWPGFRPLRVSRLFAETATVESIYLTPDDEAPLAEAKAGQYLTVRAAGAGQPPPVRSYSLSSTPEGDTYRISVKRESQGRVSTFLHTHLQPGSLLEVAAPRGDFVLTEGTEPVILISAGVGVTPVLAMLHQLAAAGSDREVWWIQAARDARQHAFADETRRLLSLLPNAHEQIFYTAANAVAPQGQPVSLGRPSRAALAGLGLPIDATAYICGPASFMQDISDALQQLGLAPAHLRTEVFGALPAINPGIVGSRPRQPHQPPGQPGPGPGVTFARSGLTVGWSNDYRSVLELADACDVPTRWSCRTGVCHTCITPILSGDVAYDPEPLELPDPQDVLICCARPESDVVVDL
jgi:ferredoxin-NADP reductase/MOSC domain-containing protein YiiM/ferredoxin